MGSTVSSSMHNGTMTSTVVFALTVFIIYMCTREAYKQIDMGHEMDAALAIADNVDNKCVLTMGPAHAALTSLTGDDLRLWCDSEDGSCAIWTGGKVIDARCALTSRQPLKIED
jgi:hypothetical protein